MGKPKRTTLMRKILEYGTASSGNYGHAGIPGQRGGSVAGGGISITDAVAKVAGGKLGKGSVIAKIQKANDRIQSINQELDGLQRKSNELLAAATATSQSRREALARAQALLTGGHTAEARAILDQLKQQPASQLPKEELAGIKAQSDKLRAEAKRLYKVTDQEATIPWEGRKGALEEMLGRPLESGGSEATADVTFKGAATEGDKDIKAAIGNIARMANPEIFDEGKAPSVKVDISPGLRGSVSADGTIHVGRYSSDTEISHEYGHRLEESLTPKARQAVTDFYDRRTKGERPERLNDVYRGRGYSSGETTRKDKFPDPYCGKVYPGTSHTEIVSMGLQYLYSDPVGFAKADPDYCSFMVGLLRGKG